MRKLLFVLLGACAMTGPAYGQTIDVCQVLSQCGPAQPQVFTTEPQVHRHYLWAKKDPTQFRLPVFRDGMAMDTFFKIARAKPDAKLYDDLILPLLACLPETGAEVIIQSAGLMTHTIMVIEGPLTGCTGDVPVEFVQSDPKP